MAYAASSPAAVSTLSADALASYEQRQRMIKVFGTALAIASMFGLWYVLALYNKPWIPTIDSVWKSMVKALSGETLYRDIAVTSMRLVAAFVTAAVIGAIGGILIGYNKRAEAFFAPLLALALAVPDPVYIIFAALAVGTGETAGYIALVLAVLPFVVNVVRTAIQARDRTLDEMSQIYHLPKGAHFMNVVIPQLIPSLLTAARFSFALSWKIVILVEALTQPDGIGAQIYHYFHILRMRDAIAYAIIFCILMQIIEKLVFNQLDKRFARWRS